MIFDGSNFKSFVFWLADLLAIGLVFPASLAFPSQDTSAGMPSLQVITRFVRLRLQDQRPFRVLLEVALASGASWSRPRA